MDSPLVIYQISTRCVIYGYLLLYIMYRFPSSYMLYTDDSKTLTLQLYVIYGSPRLRGKPLRRLSAVLVIYSPGWCRVFLRLFCKVLVSWWGSEGGNQQSAGISDPVGARCCPPPPTACTSLCGTDPPPGSEPSTGLRERGGGV